MHFSKTDVHLFRLTWRYRKFICSIASINPDITPLSAWMTMDMLIRTEIGRLPATRFRDSPSLLSPLLALWSVIAWSIAFLSLLDSEFDGQNGCDGYEDRNDDAAHAQKD